MLKPSLERINLLIDQAHGNARELGHTLVLPFTAAEVEGIHTHFTEAGDGVYFRLKDGRVFSALGTQLDPDPALYDAVPN